MSWPVVRTANMDFVRGADRRYLQWLCRGADLVLLQECKDITVDRLLPVGWTGLQDTTDAATRGSALAVRTATIGVRDFHLVTGAQPFIGGKRVAMLTRSLAVGHLTWLEDDLRWTGIAGHFPPPRYRPLQPGYGRVLRRVIANHPRCVAGLDANQSVHRLARSLELDSAASGIVGLVAEVDLRHPEVLRYGPRHGMTDHPAVQATANLAQLV